MRQFFVDESQIHGRQIEIVGGDANHMRRVLRMKPGAQVRISSRQGGDYFCEVEALEESRVTARILYQDREGKELPVRITLFQGLPKGDKMELIIQKATELGVHEIVPVAMRNSVARLSGEKAEQKRQRWQGIAESAAKQSRRSHVPHVAPVMPFGEAAEYAKSLDKTLLPYENERGMAHTREVIGNLPREGSLGVFIGPEGGFDPEEIALMRGQAEFLSLGSRILRTETAGIVMLSILLYQLEES